MKTLKPANMVKRITTAFSLLLSLAVTVPAAAQKKGRSSGTTKLAPRFLDAIEIQPANAAADETVILTSATSAPAAQQAAPKFETTSTSSSDIEMASAIQLKYAVLLNTDVEAVQNAPLFSVIDDWYGTRYELGGSTKAGIDCSAFVQAVFSKVFQIPMPRTAKEQYKAVQSVSRTELKEGDLVFFRTRGSGVSHVGIYLQNNKFVHAATSGGVMVSDLSEEYWVKHYVGCGRYINQAQLQTLAAHP
jgi:murein DD-endopeptidase / murein LD-carboxypeptidase